MSIFTATSVFLALCLWLFFYFFLSDFSFSEIINHRKIMKDNTLPTFATDHPFVTSKFHKLLRMGNYYQAFYYLSKKIAKRYRGDLCQVLEYYVLHDIDAKERKRTIKELLKNLTINNKNFKENPLDIYSLLLTYYLDGHQYKKEGMSYYHYPCLYELYCNDNDDMSRKIEFMLKQPIEEYKFELYTCSWFDHIENSAEITLLIFKYYKELLNRDISHNDILLLIEKLEKEYMLLNEQELLKQEEEKRSQEEKERELEAKNRKKEQKKIIKQLKEELKE